MEATPNLAARRGIAVEQADMATGFRGRRRGGDSAGAGADYQHVVAASHSVTTSMPGAQANWHVRK
jgi:hypothetical protein